MGYQDAFDANPPGGTQGTGGQSPPWDQVDYGRYQSGAYGNDAYRSGSYGGGTYGGGGYESRGPNSRGYGNRAPNSAPNTGGFQARTDDFDAFGGANPRRTGPINTGNSDHTAVDEFTAIGGRLYNVTESRAAIARPSDGSGRHAGRGQVPGRRGRGLLAGGVSGFLAAATALGVANLVAAFVRPQASPIIAVGGAFIDRTPPALKNFAVEKFGENDKNMLLLGMYVTIALIAIMIGMIAWRHLWVGIAGIGIFGLFGAFVAYTRPESHATDVIPSLVGGVIGLVALVWLTRWTTQHAFYEPPPSPLPSRPAAYRPGWTA
jgi:hypothetical protein